MPTIQASMQGVAAVLQENPLGAMGFINIPQGFSSRAGSVANKQSSRADSVASLQMQQHACSSSRKQSSRAESVASVASLQMQQHACSSSRYLEGNTVSPASFGRQLPEVTDA